jgi:hypothetical protein
VSLVGWFLQIFVKIDWFLQRIIKKSYVFLSLKGFHVNLAFHDMYLICDCFLMVDECLKN